MSHAPTLALLSALTLASGVFAAETLTEMEKREAGGQILEQLKARDLEGDPLVPLEPADPGAAETTPGNFSSKDAYCDDLLRQIDALKGRPLRRGAVQERFDLDCSEGGGPAQINTLPGSRVDPDFN